MRTAAASVLAVALATPIQAGPLPCDGDGVFGGFDSRLEVRRVGVVDSAEKIVGFEWTYDGVVAAENHRLLKFEGEAARALVSLAPIKSLAKNDTDELFVTLGSTGVSAVESGALVPVPFPGPGWIASGNERFLELTGTPGALLLHRADGNSEALFTVEHAVRAISWGGAGLALLSAGRLVTWSDGAPEPSVWPESDILSRARDACLLADDRVLLALDDIVVLLGSDSPLIVVAMRARLRCAGDRAVLLDDRTGELWEVSGLDGLGHAYSDLEHAEALLRRSPKPRDQDVLEAARIIGCDGVRENLQP